MFVRSPRSILHARSPLRRVRGAWRGKTQTFGADTLPLLSSYCPQCHGGVHQKNGLDLRTLPATFTDKQPGAVTLPSKSDESLPWRYLAKGELPRTGNKVSEGNSKLIRDWIAAGAKGNGKRDEATAARPAKKPAELAKLIQFEIGSKLIAAMISGSRPADAAEFLRRAYLGLKYATWRARGFQANDIFRRWFRNCKSRIERRLDKKSTPRGSGSVFSASNIHYEVSTRVRGIGCGGIGAVHALARQLGLINAIDSQLHLLKIHLPYHESDHILNFACNALCGGTCLEDIELRRNDENFLDALGAQRIPDPTTAGDFCRRFGRDHVRKLLDAIDDTRLNAWKDQPDDFFERAIIDMDGTLVGTAGQCKAGMDIAYNGTWGYHPLVLTLANTGEVLSVVNRSGNRPSHAGAAAKVCRTLSVCFRGGF